jgi:hypothetical protein
MDAFDLHDPGLELGFETNHCHEPSTGAEDHFSQVLTAAHIANGMDPLDAALQAQLDAPLIRPLLF